MDKIAELEARIDEIEAELRELKSKFVPTRKVVTAVEQEGTRISHPVARVDGLPDERQCRALWRIVRERYDFISPNDDEFDGFCSSLFWADSVARRTDKINRRTDLRQFKDKCTDWCNLQRMEPPQTVGCFFWRR